MLDQTSIALINYKGETHTESLLEDNAFADYFASIGTQNNPSDTPTLKSEPLPEIHPIPSHPEGVTQQLHYLKPYKAEGPRPSTIKPRNSIPPNIINSPPYNHFLYLI